MPGKSAGQAVVFLAPKVERLHLVFRGNGLKASMSRYLTDRIGALPNVRIHLRTEIVALESDAKGVLSQATFRNSETGEKMNAPLRHVFLRYRRRPGGLNQTRRSRGRRRRAGRRRNSWPIGASGSHVAFPGLLAEAATPTRGHERAG